MEHQSLYVLAYVPDAPRLLLVKQVIKSQKLEVFIQEVKLMTTLKVFPKLEVRLDKEDLLCGLQDLTRKVTRAHGKVSSTCGKVQVDLQADLQ